MLFLVGFGDVTRCGVAVVQELWFSNIEVKMTSEIRVTALPIELIPSQQMVPLAASSLQISLKLLLRGSSRSPWSTSGRLIWNLASPPPIYKHITLATNIEPLSAFASVCNTGSFPQSVFSLQ